MAFAVGPVAPLGAREFMIFLLQVALLLLLALLLGELASRLRLPPIVGELCAGVIAGPSVLAQLSPELSDWLLPRNAAQFHLLDAAGQIGVLLLVGLTGISMDLGLARRYGTTAARVSIAGIAIPLSLGVLTGLALPDSFVPDGADRSTFVLFLGVAMGVSAIPVLAKTLMDMNLLQRDIGQLTLSAVLIDDIVGWLLLSVVSAMATTGVRAGEVALSFGYLGLVIVCALLAYPLVGKALRLADASDRRAGGGGTTIAVVTTLILLSSAATQAMKLEAVFGALVAGMVIGRSPALDHAKLGPLRGVVRAVFAPLFFATAGLRMDLTALGRPKVLLVGVSVLAAAVVGKFLGAYLGARLSRLGRWEAAALGAGMNARGVIEVIIAMVGLRLGVLSPEMYTIIILVAIVTSLMAPPVLRACMARVETTPEELRRAERAHSVRLREADEVA
ncbi:cation:proton antiporter [Actinomadura decatromicini]|uniref:Cation:proton antiporter n=1 Tax=Actinomadura decatromicini TaxID=2604572 RepID=A0A5D3FXW9_9ACTN|nr:cation:proton antiporter [Actinomadura decatromicini]TYK52756.1 cation:proton antiporter [Actinomadura decatromicini]